MSAFLGAAVLVAGFILLVKVFGLVRHSKGVLALARESARIMLDSQLSDLDKERALKRLTFKLFKAFLIILTGSVAALVLPAVLLWELDQWQVLPYQAAMDLTLSWQFIVGISVLSVLVYVIWQRSQRSAGAGEAEAAGFENTYSAMDQQLHQLAFATLPLQVSLNGFEKRCFRRRLAQVDTSRPVFVAGLPRSGTTLLLELLVNTGEFVSHTYRDMPFLMVPLLWQRFSRSFKQDLESRERAHGDGMLVNADSPEAFEEILWRYFWPKHYQEERIVPWQKSQSRLFEDYLRDHFAKIIAARTREGFDRQRYISKNNLNIARLPYLQRLFPESTLLVPFRHPLQHANSLLKQHRNFLSIHAGDDFARQYMRDIGHYDFGDNLKPVDFGNWLSSARYRDASSINFWLEYWLNAYRYIAELGFPQLQLLSYDALCQHPQDGLAAIADRVSLQAPALLTAQAERLAPARPYPPDADIDSALLAETETLYARLSAGEAQ